ncbi:putative TIF34-translation initiation factor eIF3, p39 subunit [Tilletiaria anomala UBC 951]|uniref:Eukaryotic translation initiation factor 3 subunit I n=1 Tax=Tilletiaria anomala (strain ATCC 24038 / CBS 436.72 / UBC 951) TaxID=1037660 RepID=A0A066VLR9_TILAU|nr:putative TIF34-translation initiation factor eIF3, p39 subunit [Tilletiaria anomala UBC 951]KDN41228.1 putative TIF34-translation initiation factor eIF3, p39 subunit [Tilletiaria anomala UBC 951]
MRPILLSGHERSLNQVKFNKEGDLLFSASKDKLVNAWFSHNGERLGTYEGHNGTVWSLDIDSTSTFLVTGSADNSCKLWEVSTGKELYSWEFPTAIKRVAWSTDDTQILLISEARSGYQGAIRVFNVNRESPTQQSVEPARTITFYGPKPTVAAFGPLDEYIITGHENGKVARYYHDKHEPETGVDSELEEVSEDVHPGFTISDLQFSSDRTFFVTSSKDKSSKLIDTKTLQVLKTYPTDTPLNSASIHPSRPFVIVGGGQDAMNVTTTSARQGRFETRFWHKVFEEECARLPGHFGPINTIAIHPFGKAFASGGEDGYVRVNWFDQSFFTQKLYGPDLELAPEDQ